jgi:hypothetical protein
VVELKMRAFLAALVLSHVSVAAVLTPSAAAKLVADHITQDAKASRSFSKWSYGCGIIVDGLIQVSDTIPGLNYTTWVNTVLDGFATTRGEHAYNVLHGIKVPWGYSIGDAWLYPIA